MDVSDIFNFFLVGGGERGSSRRQEERGILFSIENPRRGGGSPRRGGGVEGLGGCLWGILGGGSKFFFSAPKCPPRKAGVKVV